MPPTLNRLPAWQIRAMRSKRARQANRKLISDFQSQLSDWIKHSSRDSSHLTINKTQREATAILFQLLKESPLMALFSGHHYRWLENFIAGAELSAPVREHLAEHLADSLADQAQRDNSNFDHELFVRLALMPPLSHQP